MGDDKQVKDLLERTKAAFLPEIIANPDGKPRLYSLEDEYAKTTKNKPYFLYLFVFGFVVLIVAGSILFISIVQSNNKRVAINISDFEDVKLRELIDASKKNESQIDRIKKDLSDLESDYRDKIDFINQDFTRLKEEILAQAIPEADKNSRLTKITKDKSKKIQQAEQEYQAKRVQKENEIAEIEKKIASFGDSVKNAAVKFGDIFNSDRKLNDIRIKKLTEEYDQKLREQKAESRREKEELILTYNPNYREKNLNDILSKQVTDIKTKDKYFDGIDDDIASENVATKDQIYKLSDDMKKELAITGRMRKTPYLNSAQKSVMHADSLAKQIFNSYDTIMQKMVGSVQTKNQSLKYYSYAFEYMVRAQQENGYILDGRNPNSIGVYLGKALRIKPGDNAYVFRTDDEYIATIRFKMNQGILVGEVVEVSPGKEIRPFDKLMLKKGSEVQ